MGDDRPFVCSAPGCGQSFTNEDHLAVHRHKHEMTLKFGPTRDGVIVADQTPTPTRFLKNCEEVGLFNELANPFEQDFKKADEEEIKKCHLDISLTPVAEVKIKEEERAPQTTSCLDRPVTQPQSGNVEGKDVPLKRAGNTTPTIVRPGSLLLAYDTGSSLQPTLPSPTSVITPTPSSNRTLGSPTGPVPVLLHLPNGQTMPVNIPSTLSSPTLQIPTVISIARPGSLIPSVPGIPGPPTHSCEPQSPSTQMDSKMRLKPALAVQSHSMVNGTMVPSPVSSSGSGSSSGSSGIWSSQHTPLPAALSPSQPQDSPSQPTPSSGGGRRRRAVEEDPDERRRRFLERNRAAASRCRQKRKVWVNSLEKKAEELGHMNVQLQNEVRLLRSEVAQLKQLLLAHKDCPVTVVQKRIHEYVDNSPQEMSEPTGSPAAVIQRGSGSGSGGGESRAAAEVVATSVLAQMATQRAGEAGAPHPHPHPHPQVIISPQSQATAER